VGGPRPRVALEAEDASGHTARFEWASAVRSPGDFSTLNEPPACRSAELYVPVGGRLALDNTGDARLCADAEGDALSLSVLRRPAHGRLFTPQDWLVYLPEAGFSGVDSLRVQAFDGRSLSAPVTLRVTVGDDVEPPQVGIEFPQEGDAYGRSSYADGCDSDEGDLCGHAADGLSGVGQVRVAVRDGRGQFWNPEQAAFAPANGNGAPIWIPADGTGRRWRLPFTPPERGRFTVLAKARDRAGNESAVAQATFTVSGRGGWRRGLAPFLGSLLGIR
jgi:hypothetical protein